MKRREKRISNLVGRIKNLAIGQMARQAVGLMTADSDKNPIRVVGLLEKLADKLNQPDRKGELEFVRRLFETGHPFSQLIKRIR